MAKSYYSVSEVETEVNNLVKELCFTYVMELPTGKPDDKWLNSDQLRACQHFCDVLIAKMREKENE